MNDAAFAKLCSLLHAGVVNIIPNGKDALPAIFCWLKDSINRQNYDLHFLKTRYGR